MSKKRTCCLILVCFIIITAFAACGKGRSPKPPESETETMIDREGVIVKDGEGGIHIPLDSDISADTEKLTETEPAPKETEPEVTSAETEALSSDTEITPSETAQTEPNLIDPIITVEVTDAPDGAALAVDKYELCLHSDSEYARDVILTPSAGLKNFKFYIYDVDKYMMENKVEITEVLYTGNNISPDRPFVCRIWIPEFISSYGISYEENGETVMLMFGESGMDGSVLLTSY